MASFFLKIKRSNSSFQERCFLTTAITCMRWKNNFRCTRMRNISNRLMHLDTQTEKRTRCEGGLRKEWILKIQKGSSSFGLSCSTNPNWPKSSGKCPTIRWVKHFASFRAFTPFSKTKIQFTYVTHIKIRDNTLKQIVFHKQEFLSNFSLSVAWFHRYLKRMSLQTPAVNLAC